MKRTTVSHKNHKEIKKDKSEWVVAENTHEPIITQELWDRCEEVDSSVSRGKTCSNGETPALTGLCYCSDCGSKMRKQGLARKKAYVCGLYSRAGKNHCSTHYIRMQTLENIILQDIRSKISLAIDEEQARRIFLEYKNGQQKNDTAIDCKKIHEHEHRLLELEKLIRSAYEDKVLGRVPEDMCISLLNDYQAEKEKITTELDALNKKLESKKQNSDDVDEFIHRLKKYANAEVLTREMALELIEYIVVDKYTDKNEPRNIHICYKFIDKPLDDANNLYR